MLNSSSWSIDRILSGATALGQSGPRSNGNEEVLLIPQSFSITGASLSDCLVTWGSLTPLQRNSQYILQPQLTEPHITIFKEIVAATDLFPFTNQCPQQAIRPLIDQSRQSALILSSSQELFLLVPFLGSVLTVREPWASSTNRPLSHHCYWFHLEPHRWRTCWC